MIPETRRVYIGRSEAVLASWPENSVDAVVCDPPYGLGKEPDPRALMRDWLEKGFHEVKGAGFMGKEWDAFVPQPAFWAEVFRVMKPGAHLLAFSGTRTYDWMVLGIRMAGFEIRDQVAWVYGSGFPKSLDVSKAIDKAAGAERKVVGTKRITGRKGEVFGEGKGKTGLKAGDIPVTSAATPDAQRWHGWGTALKPAIEPVVLARKPISEPTVAANVLRWGTGALNIEASRIPVDPQKDASQLRTMSRSRRDGGDGWGMSTVNGDEPQVLRPEGRWPANLIVCHHPLCVDVGGAHACVPDCPMRIMDAQSGACPGGAYPEQRGEGQATAFGAGQPTEGGARTMGDTGGASRFFYCAKPDGSERNMGLDDMPKKSAGVKNDSGRGFSETDPYKEVVRENFHPTVKPVDLMAYLIKLVTPRGGVVLDPFLGSGTTAIAAERLGHPWLGIERSPEYAAIAEKRIAAENEQGKLF